MTAWRLARLARRGLVRIERYAEWEGEHWEVVVWGTRTTVVGRGDTLGAAVKDAMRRLR